MVVCMLDMPTSPNPMATAWYILGRTLCAQQHKIWRKGCEKAGFLRALISFQHFAATLFYMAKLALNKD